MELWDLYDKEGKKTGKVWERRRGDDQHIPDGFYHLVCDILVKHSDGSYLLTKRHPDKDVYPGYWEASAGGAAQQGEDQEQCALRELFEETGLKADSLELIKRTVREISHSILFSYVATVSSDKDAVVLQEGETVDYRWVDAKELTEFAKSDLAIKPQVDRYKDYYDKICPEIPSAK